MTSKQPIPLESLTDGTPITYGVVKPGDAPKDNGVLFIRGGDIKAGNIDRSSLRTISKEVSEQYKRTLLKGGELLVSLVGNPGEVAIVPAELAGANLARQVGLIRLDEKRVNKTYVQYYLRSPLGKGQLAANSLGSVQSVINLKELKKLEIPLPEKSTQDRIAKILLTLDEKIQLNHQINQTLEQMAQAIFKSWFVDFDPVKAKIAALEAGGSEDDALLAAMQTIAGSALFTTDAADANAQTQLARMQTEHPEQYATLRATAELFPSAMQESELGEIPAGWKVLPLSEMVELIGGGTPKRSEPAYWNGDICWFSVKDAPNDGNVFVIDTVEKITDAGLKGSSTKLLPLGTTIITARGTVGKLALTGVVTAMNQSCYGVIGIDGTGPYLNYLQMQEAVETLQRNTHGAVFDTITQATFGTVFQSQACISLRTNFENLVSPAFEMIKNNLQQIKALSELRDTLLPKLLSGELSVSAAADQITKAEEVVNVQS